MCGITQGMWGYVGGKVAGSFSGIVGRNLHGSDMTRGMYVVSVCDLGMCGGYVWGKGLWVPLSYSLVVGRNTHWLDMIPYICVWHDLRYVGGMWVCGGKLLGPLSVSGSKNAGPRGFVYTASPTAFL